MIVETLSVVCSVFILPVAWFRPTQNAPAILPVSLTFLSLYPENEALCMKVMGIKVKVNRYIELYNPFLEWGNLSRG